MKHYHARTLVLGVAGAATLIIFLRLTGNLKQITDRTPKASLSQNQVVSSSPLPSATVSNEEKSFDYVNGSYVGTATLMGYVSVATAQPVKTVEFYLTETDNLSLIGFFLDKKVTSNTLQRDPLRPNERRFPLGCLVENDTRIIAYATVDSPPTYITGTDFTSIMESSQNKLVTIRITKPYTTDASGVRDCYSPFKNVRVSHQ